MFSSGREFSRGGHGRGGYSAPRRGGRRVWGQDHEISQVPSPPLGPVLNTIPLVELDQDEDGVIVGNAKITGAEDVASYNWVNGKEPTIVVPGKPPRWTPLKEPTQLKEDKGDYFRDPNAARFASFPMEPVVRSILKTIPNFRPCDIDLFGCGSTLGNLLRFVRKDGDRPFRFLVEVVGETVFFIRRENSPTEVIPDIYGYGHTFPEAYTTWDTDAKGSDSHQRIVRYQFGGLDILIRFEADGYLEDELTKGQQDFTTLTQVNDEDSLLSALAENTISANIHTENKPLKVSQGHGTVPQSAILDLKTRSIRKKLDSTLSDQLPRLWVRQIPFFVLAYHERGLFRPEQITVQNVKSDVATWERDNERALRKLVSLIKKIVAFVQATPEQKLEIRYREGDKLELRKQAGDVTSVLPDDLAMRWADVGLDKEAVEGGETLDGGGSFDEYQSWDEESDKDFTACSAEDCGYCGHCTY